MDKNKIMALMRAAGCLTYAEWRIAVEAIENEFQRKMNRTTLSPAETDSASARLMIELAAYFE